MNSTLARTLLIRFLLLSIIPLLVVVWFSLQTSTQTIMAYRTGGLAAVTASKLDHMSEYFDNLTTDLRVLADSDNTVKFLHALKTAYQDSERSLKSFTQGYQWSELEDQYGADLSLSLTTHNYVDIMLLDETGNMLYSIRRNSDLGSNILNGKTVNAKLASAIGNTLESGKSVYSDVTYYSPYKNQIASFVVQSVVDEYGEKLGVLVIQLYPETIYKIMEDLVGFGETGETYLVGTDLLMRSNSLFEAESSVLKTEVKSRDTIAWLSALDDKSVSYQSVSGLKEQVAIKMKQAGQDAYLDYRGVSVIGISLPVNFAGVPMLLIGEVDESEVLLPVNELIIKIITIVIVTIFIVLILSILSARMITKPIEGLTRWAKRISQGSLEKEVIHAPNNEIGLFNDAFNDMVSSLQTVSDWVTDFSVGNLSTALEKRSDSDDLVSNLNQMRDSLKRVVNQADMIAHGNFELDITPRSDKDVLGLSLQKMTVNLRQSKIEEGKQNWIKTSQSELSDVIRGDKEISVLCHDVLRYLSRLLGANVGSIYIVESEKNSQMLSLLASYAHDSDRAAKHHISFGEGLVGQVALEKGIKILNDLPAGYLKVSSSLGDVPACTALFLCLENNNKVCGVIELGSLKSFSDNQIAFLQLTADSIAIAIESSISRRMTKRLLETTRQQSEELLSANENLEEHTQQLKKSEKELQLQGEELRTTNEELEEKQELLQKQKLAVEAAKQNLELKAHELEQASKYKSEFLANMSHELRTPLNSLLILSKSLASNKTGNLTSAQQEDAQIIYDGGNELLELINDIMDLSKVEAGMLSLTIEKVNLTSIAKYTETQFGRTASEKGLEFRVNISPLISEYIYSDGQRLQQILKNFISNALKFTKTGFVEIDFHPIDQHALLLANGLNSDMGIGISVIDSGIGITADKQKAMFDAFKQEDGSTSREYGGTGLGLTISKELAQLLGGEIHVSSEKNKGSTFTLYIPKQWDREGHAQSAKGGHISFSEDALKSDSFESSKLNTAQSHPQATKKTDQSELQQISPSSSLLETSQWIPDDRWSIVPEDQVLLVIEDDPKFANILLRIGREHHHKVLLTNQGRDGILLALKHKPVGILLDMDLPDIDGLEVLEQLKSKVLTADIPVHAISANDYNKPALERGALSFLSKPASEDDIVSAIEQLDALTLSALQTILVVEDDTNGQKAISRLLEGLALSICFANSLSAACAQLEGTNFDCIILDLGLPDAKGSTVLETVSSYVAAKQTPIIVYTGQEIDDETHKILQEYSSSIVIKGSDSPERLLDDVSLFLNSVEKVLSDKIDQRIKMLHDQNALLTGRKVLLVDDDMRNVFALKRILDDVGLVVTPAENGQLAIDLASDASDEPFELILMDIMMPLVDGYQAMKAIRQIPAYKLTPIMALTAKAMPEDRQKCIDAGASDYITKPIDTDKLLSMIRVWLYKKC